MTKSRPPQSLTVGQSSSRFASGSLAAKKLMDSLQLQRGFRRGLGCGTVGAAFIIALTQCSSEEGQPAETTSTRVVPRLIEVHLRRWIGINWKIRRMPCAPYGYAYVPSQSDCQSARQ